MAEFENEFTYKKYVERGDEEEFDRLFDEAVERTKKEIMGKRFPMYINGKEVTAVEELTERSPIDGAVIGTFQKGTKENARQAIEAASAAFGTWSGMDYQERNGILTNAVALFRKYKFGVAAILSIENGKTRYESVGEVDEAIDFLNYYVMEEDRNKGFVRRTTIQGSSKQVKAGFQGAPGNEEKIKIAMRPYGVFGVIAPFNFPISISVGMSSAALVTGNTVVFKPSSTDNMTMMTGLRIYEIFKEAGIPDGVFNFITGPGSELGDELVLNPKVSGIAFTGSKAVGTGMMKKAIDAGIQKVFVVEMGGKNPVIVSKQANLDDAADGIVGSAFGYDGQKCSACSRVYVQESVKEEFVSKLVEKARGIKVGNPLDKNVYMGPLINRKAMDRYKNAVHEARNSGRVIFGGNEANTGLNGVYAEPAILEVGQSNRLMHEELFAPIITIDTFKKFDEALAKANDTEYGLTAGLYSNSKKEIGDFLDRIQAGVVYVNRRTGATTGAIVGMHTFVGWKGSGTSGKGTGSRFYLPQFLREQSQAVVK